jgi:hypothetical protein
MENSDMNKENMIKLAELIESLPEKKFNMTYWTSEIQGFTHDGNVTHYANNQKIDYYDCTTAGCIAGWAIALKNNLRAEIVEANSVIRIAEIKAIACDFLGLTKQEGDNLFLMESSSIWFDHAFKDFDIFHEENGTGIDPDSITNKMAAEVLRKVISGEVSLENPDLFERYNEDDDEDRDWM